MLTQEERIALFKKEIEEVEKKYEFQITGVLQVTPQGIIPGVTLVDLKPAFVGAENTQVPPTPQVAEPTVRPTTNSSLEKN